MSKVAPTNDELAAMQQAVSDAYYDTAEAGEFDPFDSGPDTPTSEMGSFGGLVNADGETMERFADRVKANLAALPADG